MKKIDVAVIQTGGTISSVGEKAIAPSKDVARVIEDETRKILTSKGLTCEFFHPFGEKIYDSSDISPREWQVLKEEIQRLQKQGISNFLILHGTDTMCYTASALCLATCFCTIVLTGSQRTFDEDGFDGFDNISLASDFLAKTEDAHSGVYVVFGGSVTCAPFCHKQDASGLHAFCDTRSKETKAEFYCLQNELDLSKASLDEVEIVRLNPICTPSFAGLNGKKKFVAIFGFGTGNVPQVVVENLKQEFNDLRRGDLPIIVAASTCEKGRKSSSCYLTGLVELEKFGFTVISQGEYSEEFIITLLSLEKQINFLKFF